MRLALPTEPQRVVRDELVRCETVVQLDDANLITALAVPEPSKGKNFICTVLGHGVAHNIHRAARLEGGRIIGCQSLANDFYGLVFKLVRMYECFGGHNAASG